MRESGTPLNTDERSPLLLSVSGKLLKKKAAAFNSKAMNAIFNAVSMEEFKRISNVEVAHTAWNNYLNLSFSFKEIIIIIKLHHKFTISITQINDRYIQIHSHVNYILI